MTDRDKAMLTTRWALDVAASIAMIVAAAVVIWITALKPARPRSASGALQLPKESLSIEGLPVQGSAEAPYAIVVFSEFQCPYCGKFVRETYPSLKSEFVDTGLVQFAFRHLPLSIHPLARGAAAGAICAGYQGRFWEMHDLLFGVPLQLDPPVLRLRAHELGLNEREFLSCIAEPKREIEADLLLARNLGVSSTPTFLVGSVSGKAVKVSKVLAGARSLPDFRIALDELRKASRPRG